MAQSFIESSLNPRVDYDVWLNLLAGEVAGCLPTPPLQRLCQGFAQVKPGFGGLREVV